MLRSIVPAACACVLLAAPAAARATTYEDACAKTADVVSGKVADVSHASRDPQGHAVTPSTAVEHPQRARLKVYATTEDSVLRFDGATYDVTAQTIFQLGCSGEAGSSKL